MSARRLALVGVLLGTAVALGLVEAGNGPSMTGVGLLAAALAVGGVCVIPLDDPADRRKP